MIATTHQTFAEYDRMVERGHRLAAAAGANCQDFDAYERRTREFILQRRVDGPLTPYENDCIQRFFAAMHEARRWRLREDIERTGRIEHDLCTDDPWWRRLAMHVALTTSLDEIFAAISDYLPDWLHDWVLSPLWDGCQRTLNRCWSAAYDGSGAEADDALNLAFGDERDDFSHYSDRQQQIIATYLLPPRLLLAAPANNPPPATDNPPTAGAQ